MFKQIIQIAVMVSLMSISPVSQAKTYPVKDRQLLKKTLREVGTDATQTQLLIRRMEVRNVPLTIAKQWVDELSDISKVHLPAPLVVDRLQQGLIKEVPINLISESLKSLYANLNWSMDVLSSSVLSDKDLKQDLDHDDKIALTDTISNLEIAVRQEHKKKPLEKIITSYSKDIEQAAKLSKIVTVWTNYRVSHKQVIFNLARGLRVGMSVDDMEDISQAVDSRVVTDHMTSPGDITRLISAEVRAELDKIDAERSFTSRMKRGVYRTGSSGGNKNGSDLGVSGGSGMTGAPSGGDSSGGGSSGGGSSGGDSSGGDSSGGDSSGGGSSDGGSSDGGSSDGGSSDSDSSDSDSSDSDSSDGESSGGGGMMDGGGGGMH